jgi:hypothetical protein
MNRCTKPANRRSVRRRALQTLWATALLALTPAVFAQLNVRPFPPNAERGELVVVAPPVIQMNGQADRLSPGSRIRGANNLLVLSGSVIGQNLLVNFVRDPLGLVHDVWVLTPEEAALKLPTQR